MRAEMMTKTNRGQRGFSILELIIAVIILAVLATILIPVLSNRTEQARISAAESDLERIGDALERAAVDTGYYPRIFMANDILGGNGIHFPDEFNDPTADDGTRDYENTGFFNNLDRLFLARGVDSTNPNAYDLVEPTQGQVLREQLLRNETAFNWNGPYVNWRKDSNRVDLTGVVTAQPNGIPDDPWGNDYLLFVPDGLILEPDGIVVPTVDFPINQGVTTDPAVNTEGVFDRITLLSLGPNGRPGNGAGSVLGSGDDLVRPIGP